MAKNLSTYKHTNLDKIEIKGVLNDDGSEITFTTEDGDEEVITIQNLLAAFQGNVVEITVVAKDEQFD